MTTEWLAKHGFIVKHLFGKWYLYAKKKLTNKTGFFTMDIESK